MPVTKEIDNKFINNKSNVLYTWLKGFLTNSSNDNSKAIIQRTKSELEEVAKSKSNPKEGMINYTFIHDKSCDFYKYIKPFLKSESEYYNLVVGKNVIEQTRRIFSDVAFNEAARRKN